MFVRRDSIGDQIDSLTKLRRKSERAEETNPGRLSLMS